MIEGAEYLGQLSVSSRLFDFAERAIHELGKNKEENRKYVEDILNRYWAKNYGDDEAAQKRLGITKGEPLPAALMDKLVPIAKGLVPKRIEDVSNLLRQSQLITLSAHFETFMKDIHRAILRAKPDLLRPDRNIPLGKFVSKDRTEILEEEIEREVHGLDRKNVQDRAKHFRESLALSWEPHESIPEWCRADIDAVSQIDRLLNLRNQILHNDPLTKISQIDSILAFCIFSVVPVAICIRANKLYPEQFSDVLE